MHTRVAVVEGLGSVESARAFQGPKYLGIHMGCSTSLAIGYSCVPITRGAFKCQVCGIGSGYL